MKIKIAASVFRAIMCFRAIADNRYYLNGVYLETGSEGARLVATDGTVLGIAKLEDQPHPEASIIISEELCIVVQKLSPKIEDVTFTFNEGSFSGSHNLSGHRKIELVYGSDVCTGKEVLGVFPDFRRVVPDSFSGDTAQFEPSQLLRIEKAAKLLNRKNAKYPGVTYNGTGTAISIVRDDFMVLVMPMQSREEPVKIPPSWAKAKVHKPTPAVQETISTVKTASPPVQTSQFALEI